MVDTKIRLIIFFAAKDGEGLYSQHKTRTWLWLRSWTPYCQTQTSVEESRENDYTIQEYLNQIPYDYTMEVTNRFKGLDLIDRVSEELWTEVCDIVQEAVIKTIAKNKKLQKAKWLSEEVLQIAEKRREAKGKGEKERYPSEFRVPKNSKER